MQRTDLITSDVLKFIRRNPGVRAVDIAAEFGCTPKDIRPELEQLKREKRVRTKGHTRGQTYTVRA